MKNIITPVALAVLMLAIALPAVNAQVQAQSVEIRGEVYDAAGSTGAPPHFPQNFQGQTGWDAYNFAGFWYDLKNGQQSEVMTLSPAMNQTLSNPGTNNVRNIDQHTLFYNTTMRFIQYKVNEVNNTNFVDRGLQADHTKAPGQQGIFYGKLGWFAEPYVALNGKANKLAKLIIEQGTSSSEKKSMIVGESWDIGDGWTLTAQAIDAKATPRQAWLVLSKDGVKKDDKVIFQGQVYTYVEKSIGGESDVPLFVTYVDSVFAGATSDMVQLRYTWAISTSITEVKTSDKYGVLKVMNDGSGTGTIQLQNDDTTVSLSQDSTNDIAGNMKFVVADNTTLRFYPKIDYEITTGNISPTATIIPTNVTGTPLATETGIPTVTGTQAGSPPPTETTPGATATAAGTQKTPGFELALAITGLLAVAYLVLRQKK